MALAAFGQLNTEEAPPLWGSRSVDCFEKLEQIGEGTYGQVYMAKEIKTGEIVALKKIRMDNEREGFPITAIREIKILKKLHHENVIHLKEIVTSPGRDRDDQGKPDNNKYKGGIYMVFEYMDHDLTGLADRPGLRFSVPQIKCYMKQLLTGLHYCHVNQVLHRDIKGSIKSGSRKIKSLGVKMVLSGEGSDEILGGYLYFHKAPNKKEFHEETCRKIKALHQFDCLRANKSTSAWGVEARVPFLDKEFLDVAMSIDPEWKMIKPDMGRIEKWVLRNAFDDEHRPYLPKHILYRQKEQFSDGVGYSWIDGLKDHANKHVSVAMLSNASFVFPDNAPLTKEAYYYRTIFEKFFPKSAARATVPGGPSIACSTAKAVEWDATWSKNLDPSGRAALGVHNAAYEEDKAAAKVGSV